MHLLYAMVEASSGKNQDRHRSRQLSSRPRLSLDYLESSARCPLPACRISVSELKVWLKSIVSEMY